MTPPKLYPYQTAGVRFIERQAGRAIVGDDPGLGKTPQALVWVKNFTEPADGPTVVVCPANVKYHWRNECLRFTGWEAVLCFGKERPLDAGNPARVYIINYDILADWLPFFLGMSPHPQTVIIDECQLVKNWGAKRTKACKRLSLICKHVIGLSGTPIENRPYEFFAILNMTRPDRYRSRFAFGHEYCGARKAPWGWEYKGATKIKKLNLELKDVMIRRRQEDVLKELPDLTRTVLPVDLPDYKEYKQAENDFINWLRKHNWEKADRAEKAQRLTQMGYLKRLVGALKLPVVFDWLDEFFEQRRGKIITFCVHHKVLNALNERYFRQSVLVTGEVPVPKREPLYQRFNHNPQTRQLLGQLDATCVGWPGQAANDVLFPEMGWVPARHRQAEKRPHRIGQKHPVRATYLVAVGTIEEDLVKILQAKQEVIDKVLDGKVRDDSINVFDLLTQRLLARR